MMNTYTIMTGLNKGKVAFINAHEAVSLRRAAGAWEVHHHLGRDRVRHAFGSDRVKAFNCFKKYRDGKGF